MAMTPEPIAEDAYVGSENDGTPFPGAEPPEGD